MTYNKPQEWKSWFVYVIRLLLIALVGYGFSNFRQQIQQDQNIADLQKHVDELGVEVKVLNDQHVLMLRQQAQIEQELHDLKELHK